MINVLPYALTWRDGTAIFILVSVAIVFHEAGHYFSAWIINKERPRLGYDKKRRTIQVKANIKNQTDSDFISVVGIGMGIFPLLLLLRYGILLWMLINMAYMYSCRYDLYSIKEGMQL